MAPKSKDVAGCIIKVDKKVIVHSSANTGGASPTGQTPTVYMERVDISQRVDCPDMFEFEVLIREDDKIVILDDLKEGAQVEILLGEVDKEKTVLHGEILYIEPSFKREGTSSVIVRGYDKSHRLTRGANYRTWGDGANLSNLYPSVVQDVVSKAADSSGNSDGLQPQKVDPTEAQFTYLPQYSMSDYVFLKTLAQRGDKKIDAATLQDDSQVSFYKLEVTQDTKPALSLVRHTVESDKQVRVNNVRFNLSTMRQYKKVVVKGWDPKKKKNIVGTAEESEYHFPGTPGWQATSQALYGNSDGGKELVVVDRPVETQEEAKSIAQAIFNQLSMEFMTGEVTLKGTPDVKAGDIVELLDFGKRFSGKYLVVDCIHTLIPKVLPYTTKLRIARNTVEA